MDFSWYVLFVPCKVYRVVSRKGVAASTELSRGRDPLVSGVSCIDVWINLLFLKGDFCSYFLNASKFTPSQYRSQITSPYRACLTIADIDGILITLHDGFRTE